MGWVDRSLSDAGTFFAVWAKALEMRTSLKRLRPVRGTDPVVKGHTLVFQIIPVGSGHRCIAEIGGETCTVALGGTVIVRQARVPQLSAWRARGAPTHI